jgi:hypothetical protein
MDQRQIKLNQDRVKEYRKRYQGKETDDKRWCSQCKRLRLKTNFDKNYKTCRDHRNKRQEKV